MKIATNQFAILSVTCITFLISACSPSIYRMESVNEPEFYYEGKQYLQSVADSIYVTVAYYRHSHELVMFDVEVSNFSDQNVRVDPRNIEFKASWKPDRVVGLDTDYRQVTQGRARNPEKQLIEIDKKIAGERKENNVFNGVNLALYSLSLAAGAAADSHHEKQEIRRDRQYLIHAVEQEAYEYNLEMESLHNRREIWELDALRITDVLPEDFVRGLVFIPKVKKATLYELSITVNGYTHTFKYKQREIK